MTQSVRLRITFCIVTLLLLCNSSTLSAQGLFKDLKSGEVDPFESLKPLDQLPFPLSIEEEEEFYKKYSPVILPEYFLLGIFRENMIGSYVVDQQKVRVDSFEDSEISLVNFLKDYIQQKLNVSVSVRKNDRGGVELYSMELVTLLTKYFDNRSVNMGLFDSQEKIDSYLSGAYYRRGFKISKKMYGISMHNENSIYILLKKAGCDRISYYSTKYAIPGSVEFQFSPSVSLRKYLNTIGNKESLINTKD